MWWIGDAADGNDDDKIVDDGWKSEFDDAFVGIIGSGLPCEFWLMSFCGPVKV
jgi:hypothetical protein